MQESHEGLKSAITIGAIILLLIGGYYFYRVEKNPSQFALSRITDLSVFPPTKCTLSTGDFAGASAGTIYIYGGKMREDVRVVRGGTEQLVHIILTNDNNGTIYTWFEGDTIGVTAPNNFEAEGYSIPAGSVTCAPWWLPNMSAFNLPIDVTFNPAQ